MKKQKEIKNLAFTIEQCWGMLNTLRLCRIANGDTEAEIKLMAEKYKIPHNILLENILKLNLFKRDYDGMLILKPSTYYNKYGFEKSEAEELTNAIYIELLPLKKISDQDISEILYELERRKYNILDQFTAKDLYMAALNKGYKEKIETIIDISKVTITDILKEIRKRGGKSIITFET